MGTLTINADAAPAAIDLSALPIIVECETGKVSDGYHTFDELYDHRCLLFLAWQAMVYMHTSPFSGAYKSRKHSDGSSFDGWFIAGVTVRGGQITYHIPDKYWDMCKAPEREIAPTWDGHTSADVLERLAGWLKG